MMPSIPSLALALAALVSPRPPFTAQDPAEPDGARDAAPAADAGEDALPPGVAARVGDTVVTFERYEEYLVRQLGRRPLRDLIDGILLEDEAARLGVEIDPTELDAEVQRFWQSMLARHRGDAAGLEADVAAEGFTPEEYRAAFRERRRRELLADRICVATREPTEEAIRERFEREYGQGGVRVAVRHVYLNAARLRHELSRTGDARRLTAEEVEERLLETAEEALERLDAGEEFAAVARELSHDISVHANDGFIPGYNYRRYGDELAEAVRTAEVGVPFGPVRTETGMHVAEITERTVTRFDDVRDEIAQELASAPATGAERHELLLRLRAARPVRVYSAR